MQDKPTPAECQHLNLPVVEFNEEACKDKDARWVKTHFPRGYNLCPDCKEHVIQYASFGPARESKSVAIRCVEEPTTETPIFLPFRSAMDW